MTTRSQQIVIPVTVYPGVFDREFQVAFEAEGKDVVITVSDDFVVFSTPPTDQGVDGYLKVDIVDRTDDKFILALPGEVQGASSRITADRNMLKTVA